MKMRVENGGNMAILYTFQDHSQRHRESKRRGDPYRVHVILLSYVCQTILCQDITLQESSVHPSSPPEYSQNRYQAQHPTLPLPTMERPGLMTQDYDCSFAYTSTIGISSHKAKNNFCHDGKPPP